jgi:NAD-dependent SIR2 family protein deacetylase
LGGKTFDTSRYKENPRQISPASAGKIMQNTNNIMVLTGAGISAASGIPTYRGEGGGKYDQKDAWDPTKVLSLKNLGKNPE